MGKIRGYKRAEELRSFNRKVIIIEYASVESKDKVMFATVGIPHIKTASWFWVMMSHLAAAQKCQANLSMPKI